MSIQISRLHLTSASLARNCRTLRKPQANKNRSLSSTNSPSGTTFRGFCSARAQACTSTLTLNSLSLSGTRLPGPTCADRRGTAHLPRQRSQHSVQQQLQAPIVSQQSIRGLRNSSKLASNNKFSSAVSASASSSTQSTATQRSQAIARHFSSSSSTAEMSSSLNQYTYSKTPSEYTARTVGQPFTLDYRCFIEKNGQPISPFHDIPLYANEQQTILNMVVEIPRWSNAKQEISKEEFLNPIKQDVKKGKLRFVRNCFPHKGYLWNYGAFPRTWEDPNVVHPETKAKGDNDPLDVCEIGELVGYTGQIKQVKVLGVMALLDEEETDWKVIVIDVNDPLAPKLNDVEDVERHLPGLLRATNEWFRIYKIPDGKPENQFAFSGECKNKKYAEEVIRECSDAWERLVKGQAERGSVNTANTTVEGSTDRVGANEVASKVQKGQNLPPAPIDGSVDKWFFISGAAV